MKKAMATPSFGSPQLNSSKRPNREILEGTVSESSDNLTPG
jgi:hypothetical protein